MDHMDHAASYFHGHVEKDMTETESVGMAGWMKVSRWCPLQHLWVNLGAMESEDREIINILPTLNDFRVSFLGQYQQNKLGDWEKLSSPCNHQCQHRNIESEQQQKHRHKHILLRALIFSYEHLRPIALLFRDTYS